MTSWQLQLPLTAEPNARTRPDMPYRASFEALLSGDLDFHGKNSTYASHDLHSFPAKFPPQLPRKFIEWLTDPEDCVLDPMVGSGTTVLEAFLLGRRGIGFDIDPLALRLCKAKVTPAALKEVSEAGYLILRDAERAITQERDSLKESLRHR